MQSTAQLRRARPASNVLIVDDHPLYSDALASALALGFDDCSIRKAGTLSETFAVLDEGFEPDLIMFDLKLPDVTGISGFQKLRERMPDARVLVISSLASNDLVRSLLDAGAMGYLPKDASATTLTAAVRNIISGKRYVPVEYSNTDQKPTCAFRSMPELANLTPQQVRILKLICEGKANKQIAYELSLAEATVKAHVTALFRRLDVRSRTQAVVMVEAAQARHAGGEPEARAFLKH